MEPLVKHGTVPSPAALGAFCLVATFALDFASKTLIVELVMQPPRIIPLASFINLTLGYNEGISFGLFADFFRSYPAFLVAITVALTSGLVVWMFRSAGRLEAAGLGAIAGGAIGNIVDRVSRGAVVDYLDLHVAGWRWPAFNFADVGIVIGALAVTAAALMYRRSDERGLRGE